MKKKLLLTLSTACIAVAAFGFASCSDNTETIYKNHVKVCYDAGEGIFAENANIDVFDVIPVSSQPVSEGKYQIKLLEPGNKDTRGSVAAPISTATYQQHFLAGWYKERTPRTDASGNAMDEDGNLCSVSGKAQGWSYSEKWDFDTDVLKLDANTAYTSETAVLTLYAAWVPNFTFSVQAKNGSGEWEEIATKVINPTETKTIKTPTANAKTGGIDNNDFASNKVMNKTFLGAYSDEAMTNAWTATTEHTGSVDPATGTGVNPVQVIYTDWKDGAWFTITDVSQFTTVSMVGHYDIQADLDFTGKYWPNNLSSSVFKGGFYGNGHKISNVTITQSDAKTAYGGLFGKLSAEATVENVTFENVVYEFTKGTLNEAYYGLFAGEYEYVSGTEKATLSNVNFTNCLIKIGGGTGDFASETYEESKCHFGKLIGNADFASETGLSFTNIKVANVATREKYYAVVSIDSETGKITLTKNTATDKSVNPNPELQ